MKMRKTLRRGALAAATIGMLSAGAASADVTWTVVATASGGDLNNMAIGDTLTLDITLSSDGTAVFGLGGSVYGTDSVNVGIPLSGGGSTSAAALVSFATGPGTGFGGLDSSQAIEVDPAGGDAGIQFFNGLSISGTTETGSNDQGVLTGTPGDPQFQVILETTAAGTFTLNVGANHPTDGAVGAMGAFLGSSDAVVNITVPEPGAYVASLGSLLAVGGFVSLRRRGEV